MTRGMVLGKFLPPHAGHLHLLDFAQRMADELCVVVGTLAAEPISGALRHAWIRELAPAAQVLHLTDENPQHPAEDPDFWGIWRRSLERILPAPVDLVFASEAYGETLAEVLGARFIPVDLERTALPISGTARTMRTSDRRLTPPKRLMTSEAFMSRFPYWCASSDRLSSFV